MHTVPAQGNDAISFGSGGEMGGEARIVLLMPVWNRRQDLGPIVLRVGNSARRIAPQRPGVW